MSYIVTNEIVAKRRRDNICRKLEDSSPDTYDKVRINLFGGITIRSKDLEFDESDMKSEALQFLIGFLACNSNKFFPAEVLNARYEGEKDVSVAEGQMRVIDDSSDVTRKIELLRNYVRKCINRETPNSIKIYRNSIKMC